MSQGPLRVVMGNGAMSQEPARRYLAGMMSQDSAKEVGMRVLASIEKHNKTVAMAARFVNIA